ncbi:MAG: acetate kinase [Methanotrichaceae archaeon]|nr:acetate kinase [Methanotrichaceae archaeon]
MIILVLNCGSSSIKYGLYSMSNQEKTLARGAIEGIGSGCSKFFQLSAAENIEQEVKVDDHQQAISLLIEALTELNKDQVSPGSIEAVGHRVVHGGEKFTDAIKLDLDLVEVLRGITHLAPLHNPSNLAGIDAISCLLPLVPQVAVFDTAFHQTLPIHAYLYALPYELYEKYGIRRYGFHGISHRFVMQEASKILQKRPESLRIISCHLGNGSSICAIRYGRSVDTSMGFTPLEGLVMGTRCGDLDPAIPLFLMDRIGLDSTEINDLLNKRSGIAGISCCSSDMKEIIKAIYSDENYYALNLTHPCHKKAKLALDVFIYRLRKYIGAYAAAMDGVDVLIFTGGIGQNSSIVQQEACAKLQFMGIETGRPKNLGNGCIELSKPDSRVKVLVIPTNEELMIARDAMKVFN